LQRRCGRLHRVDVRLQGAAAPSQCRELPLNPANVSLVPELLLCNRSPELCNDNAGVTRTSLSEKTGDRVPEFGEAEFLAERVEVRCVVECDLGRGTVYGFDKKSEISRIDSRADAMRLLDGR
jgi:hypothetical protein